MIINDKQMKELIKRLNALDTHCIGCGEDEFSLSNRIFQMPEFTDGSQPLNDRYVFPVVIASCQKCGQVHLFSALQLGALDDSEKKVKTNETQEK